MPPETAFASIRELGRKLRAHEFSPAELTEFFLERLKRLGAQFNAVVTVTEELAIGQARRAQRELAQGLDRGPLHGIPYGAKDLLSTAGIPTSWGAAPYKSQVFDHDATVITRLRDAGAVLCAKLAMVEIAGGLGYHGANASFTGPGLNPWNRSAWSGGSSSGSGSAVGAGLVPFAIGSETWGSIMTPASFCGIAALRPTYGRVSRHGAMALSWTMDKLGPMCRTADDCGLVLAAIAGSDPADPSAANRPYQYPPPADETPTPPYRLAVLKGAADKVQPEVRANFEASLKTLRGFATFEEITLPDLPYDAVAGTLISAEMSAAFEGLVSSGDVWQMTAPEDRIGGYAPQLIPARDYINAQRIRLHIQRALDRVLSRFDAVVTPTMSAVANPIEADFHDYFSKYPGSDIGGAGNAAG
ncbi:MAG: amidase, partial [Planctomycetes bacterium]|nr:amidase [Planctomycetota bacterium]